MLTELTGILGVYSDPGHIVAYTDGEIRQEWELIMLGRPVSGVPTVNDEASDFRWVAQGAWRAWISTRLSGGSSATGWMVPGRTSTDVRGAPPGPGPAGHRLVPARR